MENRVKTLETEITMISAEVLQLREVLRSKEDQIRSRRGGIIELKALIKERDNGQEKTVPPEEEMEPPKKEKLKGTEKQKEKQKQKKKDVNK